MEFCRNLCDFIFNNCEIIDKADDWSVLLNNQRLPSTDKSWHFTWNKSFQRAIVIFYY